MSDKSRKVAYQAIRDFVADLDSFFEKKYEPVALYNRLLKSSFEQQSLDIVERHINVFRTFFTQNKEYISLEKLGQTPHIKYSPRILIDLTKLKNRFYSSGNANDWSMVRKHLLYIHSLVFAGQEEAQQSLNALTGKNLMPQLPKTKEGKFFEEIMTDMQKEMEALDINENDNIQPTDVISKLMQGGFTERYLQKMKNTLESGETSMDSILETFTGICQQIPGDDAEPMRKGMSSMLEMVKKQQSGENVEEPDPSELMKMMGVDQTQLQEVMNSFGDGLGGGIGDMTELMQNIQSAQSSNSDAQTASELLELCKKPDQ